MFFPMSIRPFFIAVFVAVLAFGGAACGGSSSETPWPVEPKGAALGPAGESTDTDAAEAMESPEDSREDESAPRQKREAEPKSPEP